MCRPRQRLSQSPEIYAQLRGEAHEDLPRLTGCRQFRISHGVCMPFYCRIAYKIIINNAIQHYIIAGGTGERVPHAGSMSRLWADGGRSLLAAMAGCPGQRQGHSTARPHVSVDGMPRGGVAQNRRCSLGDASFRWQRSSAYIASTRPHRACGGVPKYHWLRETRDDFVGRGSILPRGLELKCFASS
jgi:hypothetical protein